MVLDYRFLLELALDVAPDGVAGFFGGFEEALGGGGYVFEIISSNAYELPWLQIHVTGPATAIVI